jgi:hypothetical protein
MSSASIGPIDHDGRGLPAEQIYLAQPADGNVTDALKTDRPLRFEGHLEEVECGRVPAHLVRIALFDGIGIHRRSNPGGHR